MSRILLSFCFGLILAAPAPLFSADQAPAPLAVITDPNYRLSGGDTISITVYNELDLATSQTIARSGEARLPLIGEILLIGQSIREAERAIEAAYQSRQFLKKPVVNLVVTSYFPREISVLGAVRTPGSVVFPRDVVTLDIVEVITRVGGFLPVAKSDAVTITHRDAEGKETVVTVDLEKIISGRRQPGRDRANLALYPGDRVWVPERLF
ncbi:polysaccharide biosynthesis/export family protein [Oleiharenicola lentus]|uniref:polysaccharide biosynthesis/export family protein n=1 Tax=Oleiharenicola lentus TaxID=2508720 RepID=UPI003F679D0C